MSPHPTSLKPLTSHHEVIERARILGQERGMAVVAVAAAEEDDVLAALNRCREEGIADAILVGNPKRVKDALTMVDIPHDQFEIIPAESEEEAAAKTAELAATGRAQIVMKGFMKTGTLLKTILKSEHGLRSSELVSHSAVLYVRRYNKLLNITDGGTLVAPNEDQKMTILKNGLTVMRSVGIETPRVAVLGPSNSVREDVPETMETARLVERARKELGDELMIEGPMTLERAVTYPVDISDNPYGEVAGRADILLVHSLEQGNIIAKTLIQFGGAIFMGVIAGAKVPISLVSRSDTLMNKMASVALAVCVAADQGRNR